MEATDQDILEDLDAARDRVIDLDRIRWALLVGLTLGPGPIRRLWILWRLSRVERRREKAREISAHLQRIARRRGLLGHRTARRATFADHF